MEEIPLLCALLFCRVKVYHTSKISAFIKFMGNFSRHWHVEIKIIIVLKYIIINILGRNNPNPKIYVCS